MIDLSPFYHVINIYALCNIIKEHALGVLLCFGVDRDRLESNIRRGIRGDFRAEKWDDLRFPYAIKLAKKVRKSV